MVLCLDSVLGLAVHLASGFCLLGLSDRGCRFCVLLSVSVSASSLSYLLALGSCVGGSWFLGLFVEVFRGCCAF